MSGKGSRERRKEAVRLAKHHIYASKKRHRRNRPFDNDRQNRIYAKSYAHFRLRYDEMERLCREMESVYGYAPNKRVEKVK